MDTSQPVYVRWARPTALGPVSPSYGRTSDLAELHKIANAMRVKIVKTIALAGLGHVGGDLSVADILNTLYFGVLNVDHTDPNKADRDRFNLSKGHCAAAFYSVL